MERLHSVWCSSVRNTHGLNEFDDLPILSFDARGDASSTKPPDRGCLVVLQSLSSTSQLECIAQTLVYKPNHETLLVDFIKKLPAKRLLMMFANLKPYEKMLLMMLAILDPCDSSQQSNQSSKSYALLSIEDFNFLEHKVRHNVNIT